MKILTYVAFSALLSITACSHGKKGCCGKTAESCDRHQKSEKECCKEKKASCCEKKEACCKEDGSCERHPKKA